MSIVNNEDYWVGYKTKNGEKCDDKIPIDMERNCTCHPDDNPPRPCPHKHAYSECVKVSKIIDYKYKEDQYLSELKKYIDATYSQHYRADKDNDLQCIDVWFASGSALTSCRDVIMKYLWRVGKKGNKEEHRKDIMKAIHYSMFALYALDKELDLK